MSDSFITLISEDLSSIPDDDRRQEAIAAFRRIAPQADSISECVSETVRFFDAGENWEGINCPFCDRVIETDWWKDRMDEDFNGGFHLREYCLPCCGARSSLHNLDYRWAVGFGRFIIVAMNPYIARLSDTLRADFERILDCPLRFIYGHI